MFLAQERGQLSQPLEVASRIVMQYDPIDSQCEPWNEVVPSLDTSHGRYADPQPIFRISLAYEARQREIGDHHGVGAYLLCNPIDQLPQATIHCRVIEV